jgi:hypothetical protein
MTTHGHHETEDRDVERSRRAKRQAGPLRPTLKEKRNVASMQPLDPNCEMSGGWFIHAG